MNIIKIPFALISILSVSACSLTSNLDFKEDGSIATHTASELIGKTFTVVTPKGGNLEDYLTLGNRTYPLTDGAGYKYLFTYTTETSANSFSYTKIKCRKQNPNTLLYKGEYIDQKTFCLMNEGDDFPVRGLVVNYKADYSIARGKKTNTHKLKMSQAVSKHYNAPNFFSGTLVSDKEYAATDLDFKQLFLRYTDDTLTIKFNDHSPAELQAAISRQARVMTQEERLHVRTVDNEFNGDHYSFSSPLALKNVDSSEGIVTFRFKASPYKNDGSILTLTPYYYTSSPKVDDKGNMTFDFAKNHDEIMAMIERIKKE